MIPHSRCKSEESESLEELLPVLESVSGHNAPGPVVEFLIKLSRQSVVALLTYIQKCLEISYWFTCLYYPCPHAAHEEYE